jgi:hypothetical protein
MRLGGQVFVKPGEGRVELLSWNSRMWYMGSLLILWWTGGGTPCTGLVVKFREGFFLIPVGSVIRIGGQTLG